MIDPRPDALITQANEARCGLWWKDTPPYPGHRTGLIGHYHAQDGDAGRQLLQEACETLHGAGCTLAIGPMDGSVWDRYRFLTERGRQPVSCLEPDNPDSWPRQFLSAGFVPLARYYSAENSSLDTRDPEAEDTALRFLRAGYTIRPPEMRHFDEELRRIHPAACAAFEGGFLFTPISLERFVAKYGALRSRVLPELIQIAESRGEVCGFLFAMADTVCPGTMILKTLAVGPEHRRAGLGGLLVYRAHRIGHECGFRRAIHALIRDGNRSARLSGRTAHCIRGFTLFGRRLSGAAAY